MRKGGRNFDVTTTYALHRIGVNGSMQMLWGCGKERYRGASRSDRKSSNSPPREEHEPTPSA